MSVDRFMLRDLVVAALKNKTTAASRVYSPLDGASWEGEYPLIDVRFNRSPADHKDSVGPVGGGNFMTITYVVATGQLEGIDAATLEAALDTLGKQMEDAVIGNQKLNGEIRQFITVETHSDISFESSPPRGAVSIIFGLEYEQYPDDFAEIDAEDLIGIDFNTPAAEPLQAGENGKPEIHFAIDLPRKDCP